MSENLDLISIWEIQIYLKRYLQEQCIYIVVRNKMESVEKKVRKIEIQSIQKKKYNNKKLHIPSIVIQIKGKKGNKKEEKRIR